MNTIRFAVVAISCLACNAAFTQDKAPALDKPSFSASQSVVVSAIVEAIDHETRVVSLRKSDGEQITFTAGDNVRNLAQVSVGDHLVAEYVETLSIQVVAAGQAEAGAGKLSAMARAKEGEMPGVAISDAEVVVASVEEINLETNTFKLKGPDGVVTEYLARNPDNLRRSEVGDLVVTTVTESVAIVVEQKPAE